MRAKHRVFDASSRPKQTGRAPLALARIRLVGFHNFVDETIEISTGVPGSPGRHNCVASAPRTTPAEIGAGGAAIGGHLFLLGDNGSGKTTVLDAIHVALTGGDIELNAAARVGGRRHEGRSLAGIVLRQGPSGIVREGASIAYVALELASATERYVIGVGLGATTLQAIVSRWGLVHRGVLEDVALTIAGSGGERPRTQSELATSLPPSAVLGRIGEYRARVAELLFGGEPAYERACRLWSIAKAYRELVLGTREPGALFERFLPAPSSEVLDSVQRSLRQLDELEASLRGLEARRACVAGVAACRAEILAIRRERERIDHTELVVRERTLRTELRSLAAEREEVRSELAGCAARLARAEERAAREESALRALTTGDAAAWARDLSTAERDGDARRTELAWSEATRDAALARREAALAARTDAERALDAAVRLAEEDLRDATEDASRLPTLLPCCAAASTDSTKVEDAQDELQGALRVARMALTQAELRRHELERTCSQVDEPNDTDAAASLLEALRHARIEAAHMFELLEPHASADVARLAALEAAVPRDVWRTVVTRDEDLVRARAALAEHPGARLLVERAATPPLLPSWVGELFEEGASPLATRALMLLAHELVQVGSLEPPDALGGITLRGSLVRAGESSTLLGSERRARAQMLELRSREARASEVDAARASAESTRDACAAHVERLVRVERALHGLASPGLRELRFALAERQRDLDHASQAVAREEKAVLDAHVRLRDVERTMEVLRDASARGDRAHVAHEVGAATEAVRAARSERDAALEARMRCSSRDADLAAREGDVRRRLDEAISTLERARTDSPDVADLADTSVEPSLEALVSARAELAQTERARIEELLGDGSRGLRGGAASLGLAWVGAAAEQGEVRIEDRAGSPIESVLAELDRSLDEARTIVSDRTCELFDVIVVGSLAKQLQRDVEHMHATVADLNRLLARTELGGVRYAFRIVPRPERAELSSLVRRMSALDPASRVELRSYLEGRRGELGSKGDEPPALLDYRRWFDYRLVTRAAADSSEETPWTRERRAAGSGGEQGVPNHLIVFALAKLTFEAASARTMPLLLDEAFQGIDAGRREGLLAFATELGLQLVVASPDQDGVVAAARKTTTLFVVKDEHGDVHLAPYHYWNHAPATQTTLALTRAGPDA